LRVAFTVLALLLVAILSAALAAPYFIDWTAQHKQIEARLSQILGAKISVAGPIDLKLLPVPYLTLGDVHVSDPANTAAGLDIDSLRLEMMLTALIRGQFRFTQASFTHPVLTIVRGPEGNLTLPGIGARTHSDQIVLDSIVVRDGRVDLVGAGAAPLSIAGLGLDAQADSLRGPFKGSGGADGGGSRLSFQFTTGAFADNKLSLKASFDAAQSSVHGEVDGAILLAPVAAQGGDIAPGYSGGARLSGFLEYGDEGAQIPWRALGVADANARGVDISNLELHLGDDERASILTGAAKAEFGANPALNITLAAKKLDFDAILRQQNETSAPPARAAETIRRAIEAARSDLRLPFATSVDLASPSAILGGDAINDIALNASIVAGKPIAVRLECSPPGSSHLIADGTIELGAASGFKGRVDARIGEPQPLRDWLTQGAEPLRDSLNAFGEFLPFHSGAFGGEVDLSKAAFAARDLRLALDDTVLTGALAWTGAQGSQRARLFADLRTDELNIASLPNLEAGRVPFGDSDLSLALEARALRVARVGEAGVSGGRLAVEMTKAASNVAVNRLSLKGLGGADVEATGGANAREAWLDGRLVADQLRDFAALVRRVAPGSASKVFVDRAGALSPANVTFKARFSVADGGGGLEPASLAIDGGVGATHIEAKIGRAATPGALDAALLLDAPDTAPLLRQFGVSAQDLSGLGRGQLTLNARGRMADGFDANASGALAGVNVVWRGRIQPEALDETHPLLFGAGSLKTDNAAPLLSVLGVAAQDLALAIPLSLDSDVVLRGRNLSLPNVKGALGGSKVSGELTFAPPASEAAPTILDADVALAKALAGDAAEERSAQIEGRFSFDRLALSALTGLALGPSQMVKSGATWSDAAFVAGLGRAPTADLKLSIGRLDLAAAQQAQNAAGHVRIEPGIVRFDDFSFGLRGGSVTGHASLRRSGADAALSGAIGFESLPAEAAGIAGRLSGSLDFAAGGRSAGELVGDLAGKGQVRLAGIKVANLDPGALGRIVDRAQGSNYAIDQTNVERALGFELDKQALSLPDSAASAFLSNGAIRIGPIAVESATNRTSLSAKIDLRTLTSVAHAAIGELQSTKYWNGDPPSVSVDITGTSGSPVRAIDATTFAAGLAQQAIARESDRIADLEADMRERAYFNRRLKAEQFLRKREQELSAYALEQARLKSELDRKRVEDETLKAAEDAKAAAQEARKAADAELQKAAEAAKKAAADAAAILAPPLPDDIPTMSPATPLPASPPPPPPRPRVAAPHGPDPTAGGIY
jgi:uncharacterized protein involved in outer membrane biogenesis